MNERTIYCDGCGPRILGGVRCMGIGAVLFDERDNVVDTRKERHISAYATNNLAEFLAVELALKLAVEYDTGDMQIVIYSDSRYTISCWYNYTLAKKQHLKPVVLRWRELAAKLGWRVAVRWIDGKENGLADKASREGILLEENF